MLKTIGLAALAAALALPVAASAQGYGTYPGGTNQGLSTFDRAWNASHESKNYTYATANWMRRHYFAPRHRVYHTHNW